MSSTIPSIIATSVTTKRLLFTGSMIVESRAGVGVPFPEFAATAGGYIALPEPRWDTCLFSLALDGLGNATWIDERHVGTTSDPAVGTYTLVSGTLSATITYGAYTVAISGTIASSILTATVTTTVRSVTEVHSVLVTAGGVSTLSFAAGTYYSQFGNNSNAGTSLRSPKLTLPTPAEGATYYLERGSVFAGGISSFNLQFDVLGVGAGFRPVANQFDVVSTWTDATGGAWSAVVHGANNFDSSTAAIANVIENGKNLLHVQNLAAVQATAGSFAVSLDFSGGSGSDATVWIHPTGSGNPNTNGKTYEVCTKDPPFVAQGSPKFDSLIARGSTGSLAIGTRHRNNDGSDYANIINCLGIFGRKHNYSYFGGLLRDCVSLFCQAADWNANCNHIVGARVGTETGDTSFVFDNVAMIGDPTNLGSSLQDMGLLLEVQVGSGSIGNFACSKLYAEYCNNVFGGTSHNQIIEDALVERCAFSVLSAGTWELARFRHYQPAAYGVQTLTNTATTGLTMYDSLCVVCTPTPGLGSGYIPCGSGADSSSVRAFAIHDNTLGFIGTINNGTPVWSFHGPTTFYSFTQSNNVIAKWGTLASWGNGGWTPTRIPGDNNSFGTAVNQASSPIYGWFDPPGGGQPYANWVSGSTFWTASDANSVAAAVTFSGTSGRYPTYVKTSSGPGGYDPSLMLDPQSYLGVLFDQAMQLTGRFAA